MSERNPDSGPIKCVLEWDDLPREVQQRIQTLILWSVSCGGLLGFCAGWLIARG